MSASEKTARPEEEPSLFEVENILTPIGLEHFVEKA
jgi:hypothetical protein